MNWATESVRKERRNRMRNEANRARRLNYDKMIKEINELKKDNQRLKNKFAEFIYEIFETKTAPF